MTQLKTLKDLDGYTINGGLRNQLRQEAIKWVKANNEAQDSDLIQARADINAWIKHFFNLKESDLA